MRKGEISSPFRLRGDALGGRCDRCDSKKPQITVVYAHARESDKKVDLQQGLFATKKERGEMQCIQ